MGFNSGFKGLKQFIATSGGYRCAADYFFIMRIDPQYQNVCMHLCVLLLF